MPRFQNEGFGIVASFEKNDATAPNDVDREHYFGWQGNCPYKLIQKPGNPNTANFTPRFQENNLESSDSATRLA